MKVIPYILLLVFNVSGISLTFSQLGFNYQAVIRDGNGQLISNELIDLRFSIINKSPNGEVVYSEIHQNVLTTFGGGISLVIGKGSPENKLFSEISWEKWPYYLRVELDGNILLTEELQAVPFSKIATNMSINELKDVFIETPTDGQILSWDGNNWVPMDVTIGSNLTAGDGISLRNGRIENTKPDQEITFNNSGPTTITGNYPIFTINSEDLVEDNDSDPANELQELRLNGNNLSLSKNDNTIRLPSIEVNWFQQDSPLRLITDNNRLILDQKTVITAPEDGCVIVTATGDARVATNGFARLQYGLCNCATDVCTMPLGEQDQDNPGVFVYQYAATVELEKISENINHRNSSTLAITRVFNVVSGQNEFCFFAELDKSVTPNSSLVEIGHINLVAQYIPASLGTCNGEYVKK